MNRFAKLLLATLVCLLPAVSQAWWNKDWTTRSKVTVNTTSAGLETKTSVNGIVIPLRLHSGNFDFTGAKDDGSDLRILAADDKTALKFHVERFDSINELAVLWVQVPTVAPGSDKNSFYIYSGNASAASESSPAGLWDASLQLIMHFDGKAGEPAVDAAGGNIKTDGPVSIDSNGLLGGAAKFSVVPVNLPANERLQFKAGAPFTVSAWIKPDDVSKGDIYRAGSLAFNQSGGKLAALIGKAQLLGGELKPGTWQFVALTVDAGKATLYLDGVAVATADAQLPDVSGTSTLGNGFTGLIDELQLASTARSADFIKLEGGAAAAQGKLLSVAKEGEEETGGDPGYMGILIKSLTPDAEVIIAILMLMFAIAAVVMVLKQRYISRTGQANDTFLEQFRGASEEGLLKIADSAAIQHSSIAVLYRAGVREIEKRFAARVALGAAGSEVLSGASIDAIKASIDADLVRENHKLNNLMVLLTIAISGGPFLGLLGTVVGVMITFAAIAAAGDVNVNAIAPGIAAALLATVAGLGVAIPALFGYNWLAARIKNISADMQIFVDEFVTRVAERYGD